MGKYLDSGGLSHLIDKIKTLVGTKQDTLVSGTNIKTINNESLLGSGNISVGGGGSLTLDDVANNQFGGDAGDWAFVYDGEEASLEVFPRMWYGSCSTAAATAAKTASITGFELYKGAIVALQMTYGVSNSSSNATLNVTSTGAKTIYSNGKTIRFSGGSGSASYDYGWHEGDTVLFLYDGTYWRIVGIKSRRTSFGVTCSGVASGSITVCKSGDCVTVSFNGVTTGNISSRSVIATIPAGYRPPMEVYSTGNSGTASTNGSGIMIETGGSVKVDPKVKNLTLYDHITYCAWS